MKPIRGIDKINQKSKDQNKLYQNSAVLVIVFLLIQFSLKWQLRETTLQVHLMPLTFTKFDKTCMQMITWHPFTPQYGPFRLIDKTMAAARPKKANPGSLELSDLAVHGAYFEPTVRIISSRINDKKSSLVKTRLPSSIHYK